MSKLLLKLSGEALGGAAGFGLDPEVLERTALEIKDLLAQGGQLAIVLGGGNLFRGETLQSAGLDRVVGDRMGMLATVMNGLAIGDTMSRVGVPNRLVSAVGIPGIAQAYHRDEVSHAMARGEVAILTGGTGNPFFTTDTAACLRGIELGVDAVLKATTVDGVYSADPKVDPDAARYATVTYDEVLAKELGVMDLTAIVLCKAHEMPVVVFDMAQSGALVEIFAGKDVGTRVVKS